MQLEDKVVDGQEAAHAELQQRADIEARGEDTLPTAATEAITGATLDQRAELLGAIRMILDGQSLSINRLGLPQREARALEALQIASDGRSNLGQFVYAEDRRDMLEQALAALQPGLAFVDGVVAYELEGQLADISNRVSELRAQLTDLDDAQDEVLEAAQKAALETPADPADKPKPAPSDPDAPRPATTLTGPELPETTPSPTTLTGPELREAPPAPTTLAGPELREAPPPPTTLTGPELREAPPPPTTLTGPEIAAPARPASTLGE